MAAYYYETQERAMAPGIADGWPEVIKAPHTPNGRLVRRNGDPSEMLAALKGILAQFKAIQDHQNRLLVEGQTFESASANWDEATLGQFIDFTDAMKAVAKAEGR